jgi:hypothetical protein
VIRRPDVEPEFSVRQFAESVGHRQQIIDFAVHALGISLRAPRLNLAQSEVRCLQRDLCDFGGFLGDLDQEILLERHHDPTS